ncbi:hypothetical protein AAKU55_005502 [Oxalobacteraceae bacterium GrIS 1.11]
MFRRAAKASTPLLIRTGLLLDLYDFLGKALIHLADDVRILSEIYIKVDGRPLKRRCQLLPFLDILN